MSTDGDVLHPVSARSRSTRSHSLKQQSLPMALFKQRSKRTMSLPSKPVLLPLINIQRCHDNWDDESDEHEHEDENEEDMERDASVPRKQLTIQKHQRVVGVAIYFFTYSTWEGPVLYVEDLFVIPAVRGQGVGSSLMKAMAKIAKSRDCYRMQWVSPFSKRTMGFYSKLGAKCMPEWTLFRMEKSEIEELCLRKCKLEDEKNCE